MNALKESPLSYSLRAVMQILESNRRLAGVRTCPPAACTTCYHLHDERVLSFIKNGLPIHFTLPAFPAKSPNRTKVIGELPDLGELLALQHLQRICDEIAAVYPPGAKITICSDGHVFSDLVGLTDEAVDRYLEELQKMIRDNGFNSLSTFSLADLHLGSPDEARRYLIEKYALSAAQIHELVLTDNQTRNTFNGMARFVFEDKIGTECGGSRSFMRKQAKSMTYQMMGRSIGWSRLIAELFPASFRMSVHPQLRHSSKFGIHLLPVADNWLTPWHGVAVKEDGVFKLVKRSQLENTNAHLQHRNGRPSHYTLDSALDIPTPAAAAPGPIQLITGARIK